jgi:hypothetical protein
VLGPEAKTRVWLVLDGKDLVVDRNGNGDLTETGKRVPASGAAFKVGDIKGPDGKMRHLHLWMRQRSDKTVHLIITLDRKQRWFVGTDDADRLQFAIRPQQAPIIHLDGPLTMRWYESPPTLIPGAMTELNVSVGTPGLGAGSFAMIQCCAILNCKVAPIAEIVFPHRKAGEPPIGTTVSLAND